jgi:hypothetical protein
VHTPAEQPSTGSKRGCVAAAAAGCAPARFPRVRGAQKRQKVWIVFRPSFLSCGARGRPGGAAGLPSRPARLRRGHRGSLCAWVPGGRPGGAADQWVQTPGFLVASFGHQKGRRLNPMGASQPPCSACAEPPRASAQTSWTPSGGSRPPGTPRRRCSGAMGAEAPCSLTRPSARFTPHSGRQPRTTDARATESPASASSVSRWAWVRREDVHLKWAASVARPAACVRCGAPAGGRLCPMATQSLAACGRSPVRARARRAARWRCSFCQPMPTAHRPSFGPSVAQRPGAHPAADAQAPAFCNSPSPTPALAALYPRRPGRRRSLVVAVADQPDDAAGGCM